MMACACLLFAAFSTLAAAADESRVLAIKAGTIMPVTSDPIENGVILIREGKIAAVGKDLEIPDGAETIDVRGKFVVPGFIDASTHLAYDGREDEESITADVRAVDGFDFFGDYQPFLAGGVTTVYISPGQKRLLSGTGTVVKLAGESIERRTLSDISALHLTLGELPKSPPPIYEPPLPPDPCNPILPERRQLPTTRMGEMAMLRNVLQEAREHLMRQPREVDLRMRPLVLAAGRDLPVRVNCHTAQDIRNAILLAEKFKLRLLLEGVTEAWAAVDLIRGSKWPVVCIGRFEPGRVRSQDDTQDTMLGRFHPDNPALLAEAGIEFAIASPSDAGIADLQFIAGNAVRQGLSQDSALEAITISPARILGLSDRIGSIEQGKDADLAILSAPPFDIRSTVEKTFVDGRVVYEHPCEEAQDSPARPSVVTAIKAGRILTASRGAIVAGLILVRDGVIDYVGQQGHIPDGATIIDATGSVVIPGMIDIHSHLGLHAESEPYRLNAPAPTNGPGSSDQRLVSIARAIAPQDEAFEKAVAAGVTSVLLAPDTSGLVCGNAALIKLAGRERSRMIVKECGAIKFSMLADRARLGQIWQARELLDKAKNYDRQWDRYEEAHAEYERRWQYEQDKKPEAREDIEEPSMPGRDANLELLRGLFDREMPALVYANRSDEIRNALNVFRNEHNLDVIIMGADDCFRVTDELKKYGVGVALGPAFIRREEGGQVNNADVLVKNRLRVAFYTSATSGTQYLPMHAAYAVRNGMDEDEALRAVTLHPAELLKIDDRIGSIDVGKDADLVILSGAPFDFAARVQKVLIDGRIVYERK